MKHLKAILILGLILLGVLFVPIKLVGATSGVQILNVTSIDSWGNPTTTVYKGMQSSLLLDLTSQSSRIYQVYVTLVDTNNVPVAFGTTGSIQINGDQAVTINLMVPSYAFIGVGKYLIVITDQNHQTVTTQNEPILIEILGDFNLDGSVNFQDLTNFVNAYIFYNQNLFIPQNYKVCDMNGDGKIDFTDLTIFASAYIQFWSK
jgi:hypothetical protein